MTADRAVGCISRDATSDAIYIAICAAAEAAAARGAVRREALTAVDRRTFTAAFASLFDVKAAATGDGALRHESDWGYGHEG